MTNHNWIYDVLNEIDAYAQLNDLPELSKSVTHTRRIAQNETCNATREPIQDSIKAQNSSDECHKKTTETHLL